MNLKNMRECDNSKIHISNNFILSIYLLIMLDTIRDTSYQIYNKIVESE